MKNPLVAAYRYTTNNWSQVLGSKLCGCCNCVQTFVPDEVVGWTGLDMHNADDPKAVENQTAMCPRSGAGRQVGLPDHGAVLDADERSLVSADPHPPGQTQGIDRVPTCRVDHITITSPTLAAGSDLVFECLGLRPQPGGEHPRMGTHNLLLRLGDALFLEVIAINPRAARPSRARWFELDQLSQTCAPRLACWVARTDDIRASLVASPEPLGAAEPMSRGPLEWLISIPEHGHLPMGGAAPMLIHWSTPTHPATGLRDMGCSLSALELWHPAPESVRAVLDSLQLAEPGVPVSVHAAPAPALVAHIATPRGVRSIGAPPPRLQG